MKRVLTLLISAVILMFASMPAMAATDDNPSPTASEEHGIVINNTQGGSGSYTTVISNDGTYVTLIAHPKNGYEFQYWTIDGNYVVVDGSLDEDELKVRIDSDVVATPYFKKLGTSSTSSGSSVSVSQNSSPTSPKTGENGVYFVIGLFAVLVAVSASVGIKLACSNKK